MICMKKYNGPSSSQLSLPVRNRAGNGNHEVSTITEKAMQRSYDTGGLESIDSFSCPLVMMLPTQTGRSGGEGGVMLRMYGRYPGWENGTISMCCVIKVSLVDWKCYGWAQPSTRGRGVAATGMSQLPAFTPGCQQRKQGTTHTNHWSYNQSILFIYLF